MWFVCLKCKNTANHQNPKKRVLKNMDLKELELKSFRFLTMALNLSLRGFLRFNYYHCLCTLAHVAVYCKKQDAAVCWWKQIWAYTYSIYRHGCMHPNTLILVTVCNHCDFQAQKHVCFYGLWSFGLCPIILHTLPLKWHILYSVESSLKLDELKKVYCTYC